MKSEFVTAGSSLAVQIPDEYVRAIGATNGTTAIVTLQGNTLVIEVVTGTQPRRQRYTLDELLRGATPESVSAEVDWGPRRGSEAW